MLGPEAISVERRCPRPPLQHDAHCFSAGKYNIIATRKLKDVTHTDAGIWRDGDLVIPFDAGYYATSFTPAHGYPAMSIRATEVRPAQRGAAQVEPTTLGEPMGDPTDIVSETDGPGHLSVVGKVMSPGHKISEQLCHELGGPHGTSVLPGMIVHVHTTTSVNAAPWLTP